MKRSTCGLFPLPAGQRLGDVIDEGHRAVGIGGDDGVADAGEGDAELLALLPYPGFALFDFSPRPVQAFGQQADERAGEHKNNQLCRRRRVRDLE